MFGRGTLPVILFIFDLPSDHGISRIYSDDVYQTLFGDLSLKEELFIQIDGTVSKLHELPPRLQKYRRLLEEEDREETGNDGVSGEFKQLSAKFEDIAKEIEEDDFNEAMLKNNRRSMLTDDIQDSGKGSNIEKRKLVELHKIMLQFIVHSRYEVGKALRQREYFRQDKRYQLGYLFNRLRRLKTEQLKIVWHLHNRVKYVDEKVNYRMQMNWKLYALYLYEKAAAFDVDIRDTCQLVKDIFDAKAPIDFLTPWVNKSYLTKPTKPPLDTGNIETTTVSTTAKP